MRKYQQLTIEEREKIQKGLWEKKSIREIAYEKAQRRMSRGISSVKIALGKYEITKSDLYADYYDNLPGGDQAYAKSDLTYFTKHKLKKLDELLNQPFGNYLSPEKKVKYTD